MIADRMLTWLCDGMRPAITSSSYTCDWTRRKMLRRALSNLLSNAIRYTPRGETVTVRLPQNKQATTISVENPGEKIPAEELPRLFNRFYRGDLIATRAVSTVNHYLATFAGFLYWCENNNYCGELGKHCARFTKSSKDPDPLTYEEYLTLQEKGCLHPIDKAAVTVAVYTGLRPGELLALAIEDVAPDLSKITVRRSITQSGTFKVPKTRKERTVLLQPPACEALKVLIADAEQREAADLTVWLNRHESRIDRVRVLLSPRTQARRKVVNDYFVPSAWNTKWANLIRRAEIRPRPPYQTRHTFACWNLTARGNLAFIANQMGHSDYSMLVTVYGRWIDTESPRELERIWEGMQNMAKIAPKLPQKMAA